MTMSSDFQINTAHPMPIYAQLEQTIRFAIVTGKLRAGERLPTVRQLAVELSVNANTVAKVYAELERAGVLETKRGIGTFVSENHAKAIRRTDQHKRLKDLTERFVTEAAAHGFSIDDLIDQLQIRRKK